MITPSPYRTLPASLLISAFLSFLPLRGVEAADQITLMERQIKAMQAQLAVMKKEQAEEIRRMRAALARQREMIEADPYAPRNRLLGRPVVPADPLLGVDSLLAPPRSANTPYGELTDTPPAHLDLNNPLRRGQLQLGGIRITLGGFVEAATIWRSRSTGADIATGFNTIPWGNAPAHYMSEFRQTERQSRFSALVEGMISRSLAADAYVETDFQGAGSASNSRQSNSYVLRARVLYGELKDQKDGLYVLGGQNWSFLTLFNKGMLARDEQIPLLIEAQYIPGFNWTRNTQIRIVKTFDDQRYAVGLSLENPSSVPASVPHEPGGATITDRINGTNVNNPDTFYTTDVAPDVIAKFSADPGWGHYEIAGLLRFMRDRTSLPGRGRNHTIVAGGGGGGMVLPLIANRLYFQASGLVGAGIGRYGSSTMPDYTFTRDGAPQALPQANLLLGLYGNPTKALKLYTYAGAETVRGRRYFSINGHPYGYGNPAYVMSGCATELSTLCAAPSNIRTVAQATVGFWYNAMKGDYGTLRVGSQYSYTYVDAFSGVGGRPHTDINMVLMSLRYLPFE